MNRRTGRDLKKWFGLRYSKVRCCAPHFPFCQERGAAWFHAACGGGWDIGLCCTCSRDRFCNGCNTDNDDDSSSN